MTRQAIGRAAFSAAVALSLGLGVRAASAEPATASAAARCTKATDCFSYCQTYGAPGSSPRCYAGRCECILL
ncbi:MAG TPA: hypothetical protein VHG51_17000 [Longimicrobiaceae bacterium]|nr:hypothetical protein [Longimicrobiaceae bacterium]